ncbi:hypothetical protein ZHAS_00022152 [Anopheles sinensis]|uniref:Secreted protein n=1 Tax=Anopheles sinensis TaxID=74873 RepID=A0A084WU76_ANOSI|nr:hypothetical protein ZHAS_00022152 [Anopheles sinensis]
MILLMMMLMMMVVVGVFPGRKTHVHTYPSLFTSSHKVPDYIPVCCIGVHAWNESQTWDIFASVLRSPPPPAFPALRNANIRRTGHGFKDTLGKTARQTYFIMHHHLRNDSLAPFLSAPSYRYPVRHILPTHGTVHGHKMILQSVALP